MSEALQTGAIPSPVRHFQSHPAGNTGPSKIIENISTLARHLTHPSG